jgi:hypothetical protein
VPNCAWIGQERHSPQVADLGRCPYDQFSLTRAAQNDLENFDARQFEPDHFYPEACFQGDDVG